jgi:hypothetical protein
MAILATLPGIEVQICVDGKPVQEYEDHDADKGEGPLGHSIMSDPTTVVKYIMAVSDGTFSVRSSVHPEYRPLSSLTSFSYFLDGINCEGKVYKKTIPPIKTLIIEKDGVVGLDGNGKPGKSLFKFSKIKMGLSAQFPIVYRY